MKLVDFNLKINIAYKMLCPKEWSLDFGNRLTDFDLWMVLGGMASLKTGDSITNICQGDCVIFRPHKRYIGQHDPENPLAVVVIHFDFLDNNGIIIHPEKEDLPDFHRNIPNRQFFLELLDRILTAYNSEQTKIEANSWLKVLLYEIYRIDMTKEFTLYEQEKYKQINKICDDMMQKPGYPWSIDKIAQELFYSKDHFIRVFKRMKGTTPHEYLLQVRINAAKTIFEILQSQC